MPGRSRCTSMCTPVANMFATPLLYTQITQYPVRGLACVSLKPSLSFSSPLLIDLRSSSDGVVAVRVVVRSLGLCRSEDRARAMFDGHRAAAQAEGEHVICYAPQTPRLARACVGTVSAVAFEVQSTNVCFMFSSRNSISCRQLPIPTPYKCPPWCWPRWKCS
jgi:hypothetical protein